jgi:hypothetical protein
LHLRSPHGAQSADNRGSTRQKAKPESRNGRLVFSRQTLQRIATGMSLVSLALGFWVFAMMIIINRPQAELNCLSGGSSVAMVGGIGAILVSTVFLCQLICIGDSAPDILLWCRSGANPPVSLWLGPASLGVRRAVLRGATRASFCEALKT